MYNVNLYIDNYKWIYTFLDTNSPNYIQFWMGILQKNPATPLFPFGFLLESFSSGFPGVSKVRSFTVTKDTSPEGYLNMLRVIRAK